MIAKEQIFELKLEDYSKPRYMSAIKSYYGTMAEIDALMDRLSKDPTCSTRYRETVEAVEYYDLDDELTHTVAGQILPILTPVREISRAEAHLDSYSWDYAAFDGTIYPCRYDTVKAVQSVIETETGYAHCVRADIFGLQIHYPSIGWVNITTPVHGFPKMVTYANGVHSMSLAVSQEHYNPDELQNAMSMIIYPFNVDPSLLVADILGEG